MDRRAIAMRSRDGDARLTRGRSRTCAQGTASVLASKPAFAAYGDSANVWGGVTNSTGTSRAVEDGGVTTGDGFREDTLADGSGEVVGPRGVSLARARSMDD